MRRLPDNTDRSDESEYINRQLQQYHHLREQSIAVFRLLIALASVFILSLTTDTVQSYIQNFSLIPRYLQTNPDPSFDILVSFLGLTLIIPSLILSTFAFVFAVMYIVQTFFVNSLYPGLGTQNQLLLPNYEGDKWSSNYVIWMNKNSSLLRKMEKSFKFGVALLGICFLYLLVAAATLISVHEQSTAFLFFINATYIFFSILSILFAIYYIILKYIDLRKDTSNSILLVISIIFGINKKEVKSTIHFFASILIIIQTTSSVVMIWLVYGWWQIS